MKRIFSLVFALLLLPVMALGTLAADVPEQYCDGAQIVVVTIDYLPSGYDSEQYANLLFNSWGVGSSSANNGLLLLHVVKEDRGWLAVGAGISNQMTSSYANSLMDEYFWPYSDAGEYDEAVATLFPHLVDFFAQLYGTNQLYGGTGTVSNSGSAPEYNGGGYYNDGNYNDYYYDRGPSLGSIVSVLFVVFIIVLVLVNSTGRRRYYRSYGVWPTFFFCGGPGPRGPRGPRPPHGPGPGGFGGGGGFRGGGFGGGGFSGGGGFHGGGFGGGGFSGGGGGGRR